MSGPSIFGEAQSLEPKANPSAGARTFIPLSGLFGAKLFPDEGAAARPAIGSGELPRSLS